MCSFTRDIYTCIYKINHRYILTWFHEVCGDEQKITLQNKWTGLQITGGVSIGQVIWDLIKMYTCIMIMHLRV